MTNAVTVSGGGDVNPANNSNTDLTTIVPGADLTITKSHTGNFTQGQTGATYTVTVTNSGIGPTTAHGDGDRHFPPGTHADGRHGSWLELLGTRPRQLDAPEAILWRPEPAIRRLRSR